MTSCKPLEDYLKAICKIQKRNLIAHTEDLWKTWHLPCKCTCLETAFRNVYTWEACLKCAISAHVFWDRFSCRKWRDTTHSGIQACLPRCVSVCVLWDCWTGWSEHDKCHTHKASLQCVFWGDASAWTYPGLHKCNEDTNNRTVLTYQLFFDKQTFDLYFKRILGSCNGTVLVIQLFITSCM